MNRRNLIARHLLRRTGRYFLRGILLLAPLSITLYVMYRVFLFFDQLIPFRIPGLGLLVVLVGITLIGMIASVLVQTPLSKFFNSLLDRIPLVRILYSSLQDLMSAFVGQKKKFTKPVMVMMSRESQIYKLGFVTEEDLSVIGLGDDMVAVYLPHSYNFSGNLFLVPSVSVHPLNAPSAEVMKFIVSGGITRV